MRCSTNAISLLSASADPRSRAFRGGDKYLVRTMSPATRGRMILLSCVRVENRSTVPSLSKCLIPNIRPSRQVGKPARLYPRPERVRNQNMSKMLTRVSLRLHVRQLGCKSPTDGHPLSSCGRTRWRAQEHRGRDRAAANRIFTPGGYDTSRW